MTEKLTTELRYTWVIWYSHRAPNVKPTHSNYMEQVKNVASFHTADEFWNIYQHLKRPSQTPVISDFHLFKDGIKPIWEDEQNATGGKWIVRLKKGLSDRMWENLVLAVIGEQFRVGDDLCGIVLSLRTSEDIISVWNKSADSPKANVRIRDTLKKVLGLPTDTHLEYKAHSDAMNAIR